MENLNEIKASLFDICDKTILTENVFIGIEKYKIETRSIPSRVSQAMSRVRELRAKRSNPRFIKEEIEQEIDLLNKKITQWNTEFQERNAVIDKVDEALETLMPWELTVLKLSGMNAKGKAAQGWYELAMAETGLSKNRVYEVRQRALTRLGARLFN